MASKRNSAQAEVEDGLINRKDPDHRKFLNEQKYEFTKDSEYFVAETNETERALCAQLMLLDTVLLTGTLVAIANKDLFEILSTPVKILIFFAFIYLLISIASGIRYYFKIKKYNLDWSNAKTVASHAFISPQIKTWKKLREFTDEVQEDIPISVNSRWLEVQIIFLGAAASYFLVALFGLLFNLYEIVCRYF